MDMLRGYQCYTIPLSGHYSVKIPRFEISLRTFRTGTKVEIASVDDRHISLKIGFDAISTQQDAQSLGQVIAEQVADRLAFEHKIAVNDPIMGDAGFERIDTVTPNSPVFLFSTTVTPVCSVESTKEIGEQQIPSLKAILEGPETNQEVYYSQFRQIIRYEDPVARFMQFYRMLLSLEGGPNHTQNAVDTFIVSQEPTVTMVFNSHLNRNETIYTSLRNEIGHEIPGSTPESTRQGMKANVDALADHVKAAISKL
jgi:hypothetical protein